jgi:hypothetical protein
MKKYLWIGTIFLIAGIILSALYKEPHYYTFFSVGALILLLIWHNNIAVNKLFSKWKTKQYLIFTVLMIIASLIIDNLGIYLGYWTYPRYNSFLDSVLKYAFEWVVAMTYLMVSLFVGKAILDKTKLSNTWKWIISLIVFVTIIGFITEYLNHLSGYSWKVLSMPFTNYKIGDYFIVFQTIGYWLTALIPFVIYKITEKLK